MVNGLDSALVRLSVNGTVHEVKVAADDTLLDVLRNELHLTSCRETCGVGLCGSCAVVVDGKAVSACILPAFPLDGAVIRTAEGLEQRMELSPLQKSFVEHQAFQCSFCTPGFLMSATAMLEDDPAEADIDAALTGHICRCGSYKQIIAAVSAVAPQRCCGGGQATEFNDQERTEHGV
jgi:carbon-monoxide dehydrogenase small subunit